METINEFPSVSFFRLLLLGVFSHDARRERIGRDSHGIVWLMAHYALLLLVRRSAQNIVQPVVALWLLRGRRRGSISSAAMRSQLIPFCGASTPINSEHRENETKGRTKYPYALAYPNWPSAASRLPSVRFLRMFLSA
jgi:hypothetical protein